LTGLTVAIASLTFVSLAGCGVGVEPLMPTPVLYTESGFKPLDHIPSNEQWTPRRVYYATNRERSKSEQKISYGNKPSDEVTLGLTLIGFGGLSMSWSDLDRASTQSDRDEVVKLSIAGVVEAASFKIDASASEAGEPEQAGWLIEDLNDAIADARDQDLLIYVHGAKVNFYNACAFAAQLDHFMGRDMTSIAFSWPRAQTSSGRTTRRRRWPPSSSCWRRKRQLGRSTSSRGARAPAWRREPSRSCANAIRMSPTRRCVSVSESARPTSRRATFRPWNSSRRCRRSTHSPTASS
jgi:hypothetical protein